MSRAFSDGFSDAKDEQCRVAGMRLEALGQQASGSFWLLNKHRHLADRPRTKVPLCSGRILCKKNGSTLTSR
jgi:hypothetical protein